MLIYANPYVCLCLVVGINSRINTSVWCLPLFFHPKPGKSEGKTEHIVDVKLTYTYG